MWDWLPHSFTLSVELKDEDLEDHFQNALIVQNQVKVKRLRKLNNPVTTKRSDKKTNVYLNNSLNSLYIVQCKLEGVLINLLLNQP